MIVAPEGTDTEKAYNIMKEQRVKKLPVVTKDDVLIGMYVWYVFVRKFLTILRNDMKQDHHKRNLFSLDSEGHFLVVFLFIGVSIIFREQRLDLELMIHEEQNC